MAVDPASALLSASEGNFILVLLSVIVIFVLSMFLLMAKWVIYENPKRWEEATSRILDKFDMLIKAYQDHDAQAKSIKSDTSDIKVATHDIRDRTHDMEMTLERRPCIANGKS